MPPPRGEWAFNEPAGGMRSKRGFSLELLVRGMRVGLLVSQEWRTWHLVGQREEGMPPPRGEWAFNEPAGGMRSKRGFSLELLVRGMRSKRGFSLELLVQ